MKIEILDVDNPTGGTPFELVAGGQESPEDQEMNHRALVQVQQGIRAASARVYNRGNLQLEHTFQITREYASAAAAELALFDHPNEVPKEGIIKVTANDGTSIRYVYYATVAAFAAQQIGCSIKWRYTIAGGEVSTTAPET